MSGPVPAAVSGGLSLFAAVLLSSGVMGFARFAILVACLFALSGTLRPVTEARAGRGAMEGISRSHRRRIANVGRVSVSRSSPDVLCRVAFASGGGVRGTFSPIGRFLESARRLAGPSAVGFCPNEINFISVFTRVRCGFDTVMPYESNSAPVSRATLRGEDVRLRLSPKRAVAGLRSIELAPAYFFGRFRARYDLRILLRVDETSHAARLAAARYPNALWRPSGTFGERILSIPIPSG